MLKVPAGESALNEILPIKGDRMPRQFPLPLPPDVRPDVPLRMWGRDSESVLEVVSGSTIVRSLVHEGSAGTLTVSLNPRTAVCSLAGPIVAAPAGMACARRAALRMLGLESDPAPFELSFQDSPDIARLIRGREGLRIPQTPTVFEALVWAIVGQQVNLAFAYRLRRTLIELAGAPVDGTMRTHPTPAAVAALEHEDLTSRQFSRSKAAYLIDTSRKIANGELDVESFPARPPDEVYNALLATRGIGEWTANYVMMRGCNFDDCVPAGDMGLSSGLQHFFALDHRPRAGETMELMKRFAPHRSLATFHLWMWKGDAA